MNFANETQFLKAFEIVLTSDMQVYLIATSIANMFLFVIVMGILYFFCVKKMIHKALHRAVIEEIEQQHEHHHKEDLQYKIGYTTANNHEEAILNTRNFMQRN
jgi:hypothetical protein